MRSNCVEPGARQLLREHRRVADQHDRQPVRMQVLLRDALDVVRRDRVHALAIGLQLVQVESVEHGVQDLQRDRARRLDRQRKAAGQVRLRISAARARCTRCRCSRQISSTISRSASPVVSDPRVGVGDDVAGVASAR